MEPKTLKALQGSIKKWEKIVAGTGEDRRDENCPLCARFGRTCDAKYEMCPIFADTGFRHCHNTPYTEWVEALEERDANRHMSSDHATDDETVMCAVLELEYLKDLLARRSKNRRKI